MLFFGGFFSTIDRSLSADICQIWSVNHKVIDPLAPRFHAIVADSARPLVKATLIGPGTEKFPCRQKVDVHPKDPKLGTKEVYTSARALSLSISLSLFPFFLHLSFLCFFFTNRVVG